MQMFATTVVQTKKVLISFLINNTVSQLYLLVALWDYTYIFWFIFPRILYNLYIFEIDILVH